MAPIHLHYQYSFGVASILDNMQLLRYYDETREIRFHVVRRIAGNRGKTVTTSINVDLDDSLQKYIDHSLRVAWPPLDGETLFAKMKPELDERYGVDLQWGDDLHVTTVHNYILMKRPDIVNENDLPSSPIHLIGGCCGEIMIAVRIGVRDVIINTKQQRYIRNANNRFPQQICDALPHPPPFRIDVEMVCRLKDFIHASIQVHPAIQNQHWSWIDTPFTWEDESMMRHDLY